MYEINHRYANFGDFPFYGNEMLTTRWWIYHINDDIVERLNNGSIVVPYALSISISSGAYDLVGLIVS